MKYFKYPCLFILLFCFACEKEVDLEEKTSKFPPSIQASLEKIEGSIFPGRVAYPYPFYHIIPNATVKLIYEGVVLDEVKATVRGSFSFEEQAIPLDKTFIYVEAPDYYPTIRKIDEEKKFITQGITLIPKFYQAIDDHAIDEEKAMIKIKGNIVKRDKGYFVYALDADGHLIGNDFIDPNTPHDLDLTIMANKETYLYVRHPQCAAPTPIKIGPFTEDTDVGDLLFDDLMQEESLTISGSLPDREGIERAGIIFFFQDDRLVDLSALGKEAYVHYLKICALTGNPIKVFITYIDTESYEYYKYSKATFTYVPGADIIANVEEDHPNTSSFSFSINGGPSMEKSAITFANIDQTGRTEMYSNNYKVTLSNSTVGTQTGTLSLIDRNDFEGFVKNANFIITVNDGETLEGEFQGMAVDDDNNSIGEVEGTFKAIIN